MPTNRQTIKRICKRFLTAVIERELTTAYAIGYNHELLSYPAYANFLALAVR